MQRYFARIIRAMVVSILGFGGGIGLLVLIAVMVFKGSQHAFEYGLHAGLCIGGVFAVLLVGVLLPLDLTAHLSLHKGAYKEIWELEQVREVTLSGTLRSVMAACRQALLSVPYVKSVSDDPSDGTMRARIGTSWRSFGEDMQVRLEPAGENQWKVTCQSKSTSANVLFDYAKNFENVETWSKIVKGKSSQEASS
jgi:hypothetical protein